MKTNKIIAIKQLKINNQQMIGLKFEPDKTIHALIKKLPSPRWSREYNMVYLANNKTNLKLIFKKFKGIAFIDKQSFFRKTTNGINTGNKQVTLTINRDQFRIFIKLPEIKKAEWTNKLRAYEQSFYIKKYDLWAIKGGNENYLKVKNYFEGDGYKVIVKNKDKKQKSNNERQKWYQNKPIDEFVMQEYRKTLIIKRASESTKNTYSSLFKRFLVYFYGKKIKDISISETTDYVLWEIEKNGILPTMQNQIINAIKYYYEKTLGNERTVYDLPRPKKEQRIPIVLNKKELQQFFSRIDNLKHRCIMTLLFSSGMRRKELINLRPEDIDFERKTVSIKKGKGDKGRISIISDFSVKCLKKYMEEYKPQVWLFVGQTGGQYSPSSIWKIFDNIKKRHEIDKKGSVHLLRHTFATSLLEAGTDIRYIQSLLGHNSLNTTQIYTHVANNKLIQIKSPMDNLDI